MADTDSVETPAEPAAAGACQIAHCSGQTYCETCGAAWDYGDYDGACFAESGGK